MPLELMDLWRNAVAGGAKTKDRQDAAQTDMERALQPKPLLELLQQPETPGVLSTLKTAVTNPGQVAKGNLVTPIVGLWDNLVTSGKRAVQAVSPTPIEGANDPYFTPDATKGLQLKERAGALSNAALLGTPDIINQAHEKVVRERTTRPPETWDEKVWEVGKTLYGAADEFMLRPGRELLRGVSDEGKPLTGEDIGRRMFDIEAIVLPNIRAIGKVVGGIGGEAARLKPFKQFVKKTGTTGEMAGLTGEEAASAISDIGGETARKVEPRTTTGKTYEMPGEIPGEAPSAPKIDDPARIFNMPASAEERAALSELASDTATPADLAKARRQAMIEGLSPDEKARFELAGMMNHHAVREIGSQVVKTQVFEDVTKKSALLKDEAPINELVARAIDSGALDEIGEGGVALLQKHGIPLETASKGLGNIFRSTAQKSGQVQKAFSDINTLIEGEILKAAQDGDVAAIDKLRSLDAARRGDITWDQAKGSWPLIGRWLSQGVRTESTFRRAMMVSQTMTGMRNAVMQGMTFFPLEGMEAAFSDIVEGLVTPGKPQWIESKAYANTLKSMGVQAGEGIGNAISRTGLTPLQTLWDNITILKNPGAHQKIGEILSELPWTKDRLLGKSSNDADIYTWKGFQRLWSKADSPRDYADIASALLTSVNNFQEKVYRNIFFRARLESNIRREYKMNDEDVYAGKHWDKLKEDITKLPELPQSLKEHIADAEEHSLKQTMAFTPGEGFVKEALDFYQKFPSAFTLTGVPFPRYLSNNISWHLERSPVNFFNLFNPKFRDSLVDAANGPLVNANAARNIGKALSGVVQLGAAMDFLNSDHAGPKYYQMWTDSEKKDKVIDLRSESPYVDWLYLGDVVNHIIKGVPMNLSFKEHLDAVANMRLADMPPLQIMDDIRNMDVADPEAWKSLVSGLAGRHIGSYFTFGRTLSEVGGGIKQAITSEPTKLLTRGDTKRSEFFGPSQQAFGNAGLPVQYSGWTGEPIYQETPFLHQGPGLTINPVTKLQALSDSTPGMTAQSIFGDYKYPELNNRMKAHMGETFQTRLANGQTLGDMYTNVVQRMKPKPEFQRWLLEQFFNEVKADAEQKTEADLATDPKLARLFIDVKLRSSHAVPKPIIKEIIRKMYLTGEVDYLGLAGAFVEQKQQEEAEKPSNDDEVK